MANSKFYQFTDYDSIAAMCVCIEFAAAANAEIKYVREDIENQWARRYPSVEPPTKECTQAALRTMMNREVKTQRGGRPLKDIRGGVMGSLRAITPTGFTNKFGRANWLCECQCEETFTDEFGNNVTRPRRVIMDSSAFSKAGRVSCGRKCSLKKTHKIKYHMTAGAMREYPREIEKWKQLCGSGELDIKSTWVYSFEDFIEDMGPMPNGEEGREYKSKHGQVIPAWQVKTVTLGKRIPEIGHVKGNTFWQPRRIPQEPKKKRKPSTVQWRKDLEKVQLSGSIYML